MTKFHSQSPKTSTLLFIVIKREAKYTLGAVRGFVLRYKKTDAKILRIFRWSVTIRQFKSPYLVVLVY